MSYKFISPIKANADAVEAKCKAKTANVTNTKWKLYLVKDKDGKVIEQCFDSKAVKDGETQEEIDLYIVESDVMP